MEQLAGNSVQVVLSLKEGKGFDKIANPMSIVATLNGLSLNADLITPEANPVFTTDLVWEATKSLLRKMRSGQEPLKVECIEFKENGVKEKIGHLLLSLRSAQIVPRGNDGIIKTNWHRLLGLRNDVKGDKPEFSLSLTIEDRDTREIGCSERENEEPPKLKSDNIPLPYVIPEERLIQLGSITTNRTLFLLSIISGRTANLHTLMPNPTSPTNSNKFLTFWYTILNNELQSKPFTMEANVFSLNEKIVMRIRSSFPVFQNFVALKPGFLIVLKYGDNILGESEVDLKPLLSSDFSGPRMNVQGDRKVILNERCFLKALNRKDEILNSEEKPYLDIQLVLTCMGNQSSGMQENSTSTFTSDATKYLETVPQKLPATTPRNPAASKNPRGIHDCDHNQMNHYSTFQIPQDRPENPITHSTSEQPCANSVESYHCYCLRITLTSLSLQCDSTKNIQFTFHHPKVEALSTLSPTAIVKPNETVTLEDIFCKLNFVSSIEEIKHLLLKNPPKLSIRDEGCLDKSPLGQTLLDVRRIFKEPTFSTQYEAILFDTSLNEVGSVQVSMHLEDHGPYNRTTRTTWSDNLGPPILDESLVSKIIQELQTWKEKQQEMFQFALMQKEERHLNLLSEEWQRRRESLETQLACSLDQCKLLANNLNKATDDLRNRRLQGMEKESQLMKENEDLKWSYDRKLRDLKEASEKMREDCSSKMSRLEEENKNLEDRLAALQQENNRLQKINTKHSEDLLKSQQSLASNQTENLMQQMESLESKLNHAVNGKAFFKEQWGKAVREIHQLKMEHQQALELQIKSSREELKNIDLEQLLEADSAALSNDKILLKQIQREINVIKPRSSYTINPEEPLFHSAYESCSRSTADFGRQYSGKCFEEDERLRKLIEQRDTLLKTGNYNFDDAIIIKLNSEIRPLLMSR